MLESSQLQMQVQPISIQVKKGLNRTNNTFTIEQKLEPASNLQNFETERKKNIIAFKLNKLNQDQQIYQSKLYDHTSNGSRNFNYATESQLQNALSTMYSNGKRSKISKNYEYAKLFEDSSLGTTTLRKERMYRSIERMKQKAEKIKQESLDQQKKSELIKFYQNQFGISLSPHQLKFKVKFMEKSQLEVMLEEKLISKRQQMAAIQIQKVFKGYMIRKYMKMLAYEREKSARIIQRVWRRFMQEYIAPRKLFQQQEYAAIFVQKFIRRYLIQKQMMQEISQLKISTCYEYFNIIRQGIQEDAQIKIAYHWRKYVKERKIKEELKKKKQQQIDAQKKRNKVNNFRQKEKTSPMNKMKNLGNVMMSSQNANMISPNEKSLKSPSPGPGFKSTLGASPDYKIIVPKGQAHEDAQKSQSKTQQKTGKTPEKQTPLGMDNKFGQPSLINIASKHSRESSGVTNRRNSTSKQPLKFGESSVEKDRHSFDQKEELKSDNGDDTPLRLEQNEIQEITQEGEDELMENDENNSALLEPDDQDEIQS